MASHDRAHPVALPGYAHRRAKADISRACPLCAQPYDISQPRGFSFPVVATLIHPALGGPLSADNAFICCRRCQQQRGSSDLLATHDLPDTLRAQRHAALLSSRNHLLPLSITTRSADFIKALTQRHALPRFRVFAAQSEDGVCFLGVPARFGDGQSRGLARLLAKQAGSVVQQAERRTVYRLDDDAFRLLVWKLIEANALVVALAHGEPPRDFQDCWWATSASPAALRLRQVGATVPDPVSRTRIPGSRMGRQDQRRMEAELRLASRKADALRQAVNDHHKGSWLDGQEGDADADAALLRQLDETDRQVDELRSRLATLRRHSPAAIRARRSRQSGPPTSGPELPA